MLDVTFDLSALECPYCGAEPFEACVADCPQYPITIMGDIAVPEAVVLAEWRTEQRAARA